MADLRNRGGDNRNIPVDLDTNGVYRGARIKEKTAIFENVAGAAHVIGSKGRSVYAQPKECCMPTNSEGAFGEFDVPLLSLDNLVEITRVPKSTLYSLNAKGRGPRSMKIGRALRFRPADVGVWLDGLSGIEESAA